MDRKPTPSLGAQIDALHDNREEIRKINKQLKLFIEQKEILEQGLLATMAAQDIEQSRGNVATATVSTTTVPNVIDWDSFYAFIKENDAFYLLDRRPATLAYRELLEAREGEAIPGVQPYDRITISLRSR